MECTFSDSISLILKTFIYIFVFWCCVIYLLPSNDEVTGLLKMGVRNILQKVVSVSFSHANSSLSGLHTEAKHQFYWQLYSVLGNSGYALACRDSESILALTPDFIVKHTCVDIVSVFWTITCIQESLLPFASSFSQPCSEERFSFCIECCLIFDQNSWRLRYKRPILPQIMGNLSQVLLHANCHLEPACLPYPAGFCGLFFPFDLCH